ncbi:DUF748 domain-containing protein [Bdellovibrio sp. 22V]|uniref:DUF748 domain-containing protein n=1 Tax=Bdellovibrio TaxID=958 RepID=UPI002543A144|nr:DUF748 domain-containing protein [Bdellovibrio sp. 22V]WII73118.1 DUF748 domain-containing protein [Bdellovibrio sp. 22V]
MRKILLSILVILIVIRIAAPPIILSQINKFLEDFSPSYQIHIGGLDLAIWRGAYRFEKIDGRIKTQKDPFMTVDAVDVSIAWREIIRGTIKTDIVVTGANLLLSKELMDVASKAPKKPKDEAQELGDKLFPLEIDRIDIRSSNFQFADVPGLPPELRLRVSDLDGRLTNLTPDKENPWSLATVRGTVQGSSVLKLVGEYSTIIKPLPWHVSAEVQKFEMKNLNPFTQRAAPISFQQGYLDAFVEAKSEENVIVGYVKPFVSKLDVVGNEKDFQGFKHFGIELSAATANLIFRRASDNTVATIIDFSVKDGKFDWNASKAFKEAVEHGFAQPISPGLENRYDIMTKQKGKIQ